MKWMSPLATAAVLLGCGGGSPSQPTDTGGSGLTVAVRNNLFDPATLQVPVNSTVTWQWNSGGVEHNVTFQTAPSSGNQTSGSFPRLFSTAGTFPYECTIHGAQVMSGVVTVAGTTGGSGGGGEGGGGGSGGGGGTYGP
jgi:plastocyanin